MILQANAPPKFYKAIHASNDALLMCHWKYIMGTSRHAHTKALFVL